MAFIDVEKHYVFYGAYHSHPVNIFIHMLFVWPIYFTVLLYLAFTSPLYPLPLPSDVLPYQQYMVINWSFLGAAFYALFYISLDRKAGSVAALLCLICWVGSNALAQKLGFSLGWKVVLISQIICWTAQFIGHGVFEGRRPALVDNIFQAFIMAPYFVLFEVLHMMFGYEPYSGFQKNVQGQIQTNIDHWKAQKKAKKQS